MESAVDVSCRESLNFCRVGCFLGKPSHMFEAHDVVCVAMAPPMEKASPLAPSSALPLPRTCSLGGFAAPRESLAQRCSAVTRLTSFSSPQRAPASLSTSLTLAARASSPLSALAAAEGASAAAE